MEKPHYRDDDSTFVQISTWKHEANNPNDVTLAGAFTEGQGIPQGLIQQDSASEAELGNSDGSDASIDSHPEIHPPSSVGNRQEAILFHLRDEPIRTFLEWTEYDQMIAEIAFHYSVNPASVVGAYEVNTPLPGLPPDAIPIIAHLFPDIAVGQQAKLVLFDIEVHGHRSEPHFQVGPATRRFVLLYLNGLTGSHYSFWPMWIFIVRLKAVAVCFGLMDLGGLIMISDNDVLPMETMYELQFHHHSDMIAQLRKCFTGHRLASLILRFWTRSSMMKRKLVIHLAYLIQMRYERLLDLAVKLKRMMFSMRCNPALLPIALIALPVIGAEHLLTGI